MPEFNIILIILPVLVLVSTTILLSGYLVYLLAKKGILLEFASFIGMIAVLFLFMVFMPDGLNKPISIGYDTEYQQAFYGNYDD